MVVPHHRPCSNRHCYSANRPNAIRNCVERSSPCFASTRGWACRACCALVGPFCAALPLITSSEDEAPIHEGAAARLVPGAAGGIKCRQQRGLRGCGGQDRASWCVSGPLRASLHACRPGLAARAFPSDLGSSSARLGARLGVVRVRYRFPTLTASLQSALAVQMA